MGNEDSGGGVITGDLSYGQEAEERCPHCKDLRPGLHHKGCPAIQAEINGKLKAKTALDVQIGGDHYKKLKIQPMEYSMANGLDACQHTAIKYITRFRDKGGIADLEKAKHCIDLLIEFESKL